MSNNNLIQRKKYVKNEAEKANAIVKTTFNLLTQRVEDEYDQILKALISTIDTFVDQYFPGKTQNDTNIAERIKWGWNERLWEQDSSVSTHQASTGHYVKVGKAKLFQKYNERFNYFVPFIGRSHLAFLGTGDELDQANQCIESIVYQMLTSLHPSNTKVIAIDPVGLGQNFSLLTALDEKILGPKIYHSKNEVDTVLDDAIESISMVIQKYLSTHYENIDDFNKEAGVVAESYKLICIANFPANLSIDSINKIINIASNGSRVGVHLLISLDKGLELPVKMDLKKNLLRFFEQIEYKSGSWNHQLTSASNRTVSTSINNIYLDKPPSLELVNKFTKNYNEESMKSTGVKVEFKPPQILWNKTSEERFSIPIGQVGARQVQSLTFGEKAHHALIGGRTGMGKTVLLHNIITSSALEYNPNEINLYLIDFKEGVEFQIYQNLPHLKVLALDADRDFGLSVLSGINKELEKRGELFKENGANSLTEYRNITGIVLPRAIVVIDEFQVLINQSDRIATKSRALIDDIMRRGRSFGINMILSTQTLHDVQIETGTLSQIGTRIGLSMNESDSHKILGHANDAAKFLSRPGEAIYNEDNQDPASNKRFQIYFENNDKWASYAKKLSKAANQKGFHTEAIIFRRDDKIRITQNKKLWLNLLSRPVKPKKFTPMFIGKTLSLDMDHYELSLTRQSGGNILVVGNDNNTCFSTIIGLVSSFIAHTTTESKVIFINHDDVVSDYNEYLDELDVSQIEVHHAMEEASQISLLYTYMKNQESAPKAKVLPATKLLVIYGIHNSRLYPTGYGVENETSKQLKEIISKGPYFGIHTVIWSNNQTNVRTLSQSLGINLGTDFGHKILASNEAMSLVAISMQFERGMIYYHSPDGDFVKIRPYYIDYKSNVELKIIESKLG